MRHSTGMRILGPTKVEVAGKVLTSFAGTNYLGLSFHPRILEALSEGAGQSGFGMGASRKTTGSTREVLELERKIASLTGVPSALVTTSGTLANAGLLEGLRGAIDHWLIDERIRTPALPVYLSSTLRCGDSSLRTHLDVEDLARRVAALEGNIGVFAGYRLCSDLEKLRPWTRSSALPERR